MAYFAASTDAVETNRAFASDLALDYPILSDADAAVARAYGVVGLMPWASPWTFYIGPDQRILAIDTDVNVSTAGADVARRLAELGVARRAGR